MEYLTEFPTLEERRDFRRFPPRYGDPHYHPSRLKKHDDGRSRRRPGDERTSIFGSSSDREPRCNALGQGGFMSPMSPSISTGYQCRGNYGESSANSYFHKLLFAGFLIPSCPKCALVWGTVVRGLRVEIFVRVLHSSRVNLNNVNNTNVFCFV